jgi:adenylosuccinate synthase
MTLVRKNIYAFIDGMAGSCGKGKAIGQFAIENNVSAAIANCMPNAGHTFSQDGKKRIFRLVPVSAVNPNTALFMGAGTVIDMNVLEQEYEENIDILEGREIIVHPMVPIIQQKHIDKEKEVLRSGSTFKGGGACLAEKIMRSPDTIFFKEFKNIKADPNYHKKLLKYLNGAKKVILEGSQGCDLDINHSGHYPYVTSRQISIAQMCADAGISPMRIKEIIMVIRPFPIRISNQTNIGQDIFSGTYGNSEELSWEQIRIGAMMGWYPPALTKSDLEDLDDFTAKLNLNPEPVSELTTVTKKPRRVFDIDIEKLRANIEINTPTSIYLNFFQYLGDQYAGLKGDYNKLWIDKYQREYLNWLERELRTKITMLGTGADIKEYIKIN